MDKKQVLETLHYLKNNSPKRNFKQNIDFLLVLKQLNIKKDTDKVLQFAVLPYDRGKKQRIGAFVGQELVTTAKATCDKVILVDEFKSYDKKTMKKLARDIDIFVAQANLMPQVAATFGKVLGPRGKMPNPKAGCIIPPTADMKSIVQKLHKTVRLETKTDIVIRTVIGKQEQNEEEVAENILHVYNTLLHALPQERNNIKHLFLKYTMGPAVNIENLPNAVAAPVVETETPKKKTKGAKHGA
ncbi:MAG: hypothetical protein Q7R96_00365 [Nanoarchaeota archaeon]|nr:hypothetical protein [Nanoarchaeota archaeon]